MHLFLQKQFILRKNVNKTKVRSICTNNDNCVGEKIKTHNSECRKKVQKKQYTNNENCVGCFSEIQPRKKLQEHLEVYKLSYPHQMKIEPITITPLYIDWIGRRWYSSP